MQSFLEPKVLILADCLQVLERLPDESIDLIYVDPPWNESDSFMQRVLRQYWRVLHPNGNLLVHTKQGIPDIAIVDLLNGVFGKQNAREEVILPTGMKPPTHPRYEYVRRYAKHAKAHRDLPDHVWDFTAYDLNPHYKTAYLQRPLALIDTLVGAMVDPGGTVLDTFCGTGTTLAAAHRHGCRWIGCDNEPLAIRDTRERLSSQADAPVSTYQSWTESELNEIPVVRSSSYPTFFISYSRSDAQYVDAMCDRMQEEYIYYWRDTESITGGTYWDQAIKQALDDSDAMLLFVSEHAMQSTAVQREYLHFAELKRTIYPIFVENIPLPPEIALYEGIPYTDMKRILTELRQFDSKKRITP